ncbi:MAG: rhomboid family intramembrane serine protease [Bacteroidia bacterium]|nr:rhomboid family intramembrane serine protease [Bacteroidia bacterium]
MNIWEEIKFKYRTSDSNVLKFIYINVAVFIIERLVYLVFWLFKSNNDIVSFFVLSSDGGIFIRHPWTIITYQFIHEGIFHILFNMLWLYTFGNLLEGLIGKKHIVKLYFLGGIAGGLLFLGAYNFLPVFENISALATCRGASASAMAIMVATAVYMPEQELALFGVFRIKLKWLAAIIISIDVIMISAGNSGGHIAHLGGALFGWLYVLYIRGNIRFPTINIFNKRNKIPTRKFKVDVNRSAVKNSGRIKPSQDDIDAILDKISRSGYDRLTSDEKDMLFKASQK